MCRSLAASCARESRRDQEEGGELDPQVSPEEIKSREVELGLKVGLLLPQLFLDSCATDIVFVSLFHTAVETAIILRSTLVAAQWRGDTALTFFFLIWRRCTAS